MGNATMLEVYGLIVPALGMFLLYILPLPYVSSVISRCIVAVESHSFHGLTILSAFAILSSFAFLGDFLTWQNKYDTKKNFFADISMKLQYDNSRLRLERNIYIHMLACVLCLALKKCAMLTIGASSAKHSAPTKSAAPVPSATASTPASAPAKPKTE